MKNIQLETIGFNCSLNFIWLLRVVITPSVMSLLRGENDLKQSDEFQASLTVFLPEITYKHLFDR